MRAPYFKATEPDTSVSRQKNAVAFQPAAAPNAPRLAKTAVQ
jgi:hypothetical protein